jgi:predicted transcriptional regulator of viral defense system
MSSKYTKLIETGRNVFNLDDLASIWGQNKRSDTLWSARKYAREGKLHRIKRGLYVLNPNNPDTLEVANKAFAPSYVTGPTILIKHGLSFQFIYYVHSAALRTKQIKIDEAIFFYHKIKSEIFYNRTGIIVNNNGTEEASLERAICDTLYLNLGDWAFEHTDEVDWNKVREIADIYGSKAILRKINELEKTNA